MQLDDISKKISFWEVFGAQLAKRSLTTPEDRGLKPFFQRHFDELFIVCQLNLNRKDQNKQKRPGKERPIFNNKKDFLYSKQGVGVAMIILCIIVTIYYNVIMAYSVVYLGASIVGTYEELPWTYCGNNRLLVGQLLECI